MGGSTLVLSLTSALPLIGWNWFHSEKNPFRRVLDPGWWRLPGTETWQVSKARYFTWIKLFFILIHPKQFHKSGECFGRVSVVSALPLCLIPAPFVIHDKTQSKHLIWSTSLVQKVIYYYDNSANRTREKREKLTPHIWRSWRPALRAGPVITSVLPWIVSCNRYFLIFVEANSTDYSIVFFLISLLFYKVSNMYVTCVYMCTYIIIVSLKYIGINCLFEFMVWQTVQRKWIFFWGKNLTDVEELNFWIG